MRTDCTSNTRHANLTQDEPKHAEIEDRDGACQKSDGEDVHGLDHRGGVVGFANRCAEVRVVENLAKVLDERLCHKMAGTTTKPMPTVSAPSSSWCRGDSLIGAVSPGPPSPGLPP